jgi:hypothetical protein
LGCTNQHGQQLAHIDAVGFGTPLPPVDLDAARILLAQLRSSSSPMLPLANQSAFYSDEFLLSAHPNCPPLFVFDLHLFAEV